MAFMAFGVGACLGVSAQTRRSFIARVEAHLPNHRPRHLSAPRTLPYPSLILHHHHGKNLSRTAW